MGYGRSYSSSENDDEPEEMQNNNIPAESDIHTDCTDDTNLKTSSKRKEEELKKEERIQTQSEEKNSYRKLVIDWLDLFPKVPRHYFRKFSYKLYVESRFRSYLHMFNVFSDWCKEKDIQPMGRKLFQEIINKENIIIYSPERLMRHLLFL